MGTMDYYPGMFIVISNYLIGDPADFQEMYDQDVAQGWGVVHKQGNGQFLIEESVYIISGYFGDINKQVEFGDDKTFQIAGNAHFRLGEVDSVVNQTGKNGCTLVFHPYDGTTAFNQGSACDLELYNSQIIYESGGSGNGAMNLYAHDSWTFRVWGCRMRGGEYIQIEGDYAEGKYAIARTDVEDFRFGLLLSGDYSSTFLTDVRMISCYSAIYFFNTGGTTVYGLECIDVGILAYFSSASGTYNLINCKSNSWSWYGISTCTVNRQYTFDAKLVESDGDAIGDVNVKMWDVNDDPVVDVNTYPVGHANEGEIPVQIVTSKTYPGAVTKTPHTMKGLHYDYVSLASKFDVDVKIDWLLTMVADPWITKDAAQAAAIGGTCNP